MNRLRRAATGGSAAVLVMLSLTSCSSDDQLEAGEVASSSTTVEGRTVEVVIPSGTLILTLSDPTEDLAGFSAPGGGSLIGISTDFRQGEVRDDVRRFSARADTLMPAEVTVRIGDNDYPVGTVRSASVGADPLLAQFVLAVEEAPEDAEASVEVTYDGLTQVVDADGTREPGPADALYEEPRPLTPAACDDVAVTGGVDPSAIECRVDRADQVPYLPGPGWAASGRSWLAVAVAVGFEPVALSDGGTYALDSVDDSSSVDGVKAAAVLDPAEPIVASGWSATLVFDTPLDDVPPALDVDLALGLTRADGQLAEQGPEPLRLTASVPLADAS